MVLLNTSKVQSPFLAHFVYLILRREIKVFLTRAVDLSLCLLFHSHDNSLTVGFGPCVAWFHRHGDGIKGDRQFDEMDAVVGAALQFLG